MSIQQLSLFDETITPETVIEAVDVELTALDIEVKEEVYIGQKVKIRIPEDKESEEYYYLKYYCTAHLSRTGEISTISQAASGKIICEVNFYGETFLFHIDELKLL